MNEKAKKIATIGWFATPNKPGDRTLEQQMTGLDKVLAEVAGKTVIDAGCAEGLISMEMAKAGAVKCVGLEVIAGHVELGKALVGDLPVELKVANLNDFDLSALEPADIVLMLAVLHKLKDPSAVCANLAALAKDLCVIRLPPYGPV
ncbi:MAG TPA: methyltransferase domain-containing protein, partial [Burkholderiaceae bacterium]|nr:methyltransferase domain-containing protein [Burkholderiaceae bacterium]